MTRNVLRYALLTAAGLVERVYPDLAPLIVGGPILLAGAFPALARRFA